MATWTTAYITNLPDSAFACLNSTVATTRTTTQRATSIYRTSATPCRA